jgi:hypothetical protein
MMSRCWTRDDPVRDAEDAATDKRPILGYCAECGCEIHGGNDFYEPDDAYYINGDYICDDHLRDYFEDCRIR